MNLSTAIVLIILTGIVAIVIKSIVKDKKSGKSSCGGNCGSCGNHLCSPSALVNEYYKDKKLPR